MSLSEQYLYLLLDGKSWFFSLTDGDTLFPNTHNRVIGHFADFGPNSVRTETLRHWFGGSK